MGNKILVAVFVVLLTVFVGEVGYLFYTAKQAPSKTSESNVSPSPTTPVKRNGIQAVDDQTVESIKNINSGILSESTLINKYEGQIIKFSLEEGTSARSGLPDFKYGFEMGLKGKNEESNTFFYGESDIALMKVSSTAEDGTSQALTVQDLKVGDYIIITETWDLKKDVDHNILSISISIL